MIFDVLLLDVVGPAYDETTVKGVGGSEFFVLKLARGLAETGLKVAVVNRCAEDHAAWLRIGEGLLHWRSVFTLSGAGDLRCRTLVLQRVTPLPVNVEFDRIVVAVHDAPSSRDLNLLGTFMNRLDARLVCVSEYQRALYPKAFPASVIPPALLELPPAIAQERKDRDAFLFPSAAMKGWKETARAWLDLKKLRPDVMGQARLYVLSSGYDRAVRVEDESLVYMPPLEDEGLVALVNGCAGLFYVNAMPEMFPMPVAIADALGVRTHVHCLRGFGGMRAATRQSLVTDDADEFREAFLARRPGFTVGGFTTTSDGWPLAGTGRTETLRRWREFVT